MSTPAAPAPEAKIAEPPPLDPKGAPTPEQKDAILSMFKPKGKVEVVKVKETPFESVKAETKETPKESVKEAPKEPQNDAEKNFAALRAKTEAAEKAFTDAAAERDKLKAEYEEYKKRPAPDDVLKELAETRKAKETYQKELQIAALQRDPEFNAKFDAPIRTGMQQMVDILVAAGIDKAEATKAVPAWNKTFFAEAMESMGPVERLEFGAAMQGVVTTYNQKESELANAEQTWQGRMKEREESAKAQQARYVESLRADIAEAIKEAGETPLGKERADVLKEAQVLVERAAGVNGERLSNREMLSLIGKSHLLATGFQKQTAVLAEKEAKIAELEKTLSERNAFIEKQHGSIPGVNGNTPEKKTTRADLARQFLNPTVR